MMDRKAVQSEWKSEKKRIVKPIRFHGFTLVELIVVITILAILATVGFLALSGYTQDAKDSAIKANVRSLQTAITSEAAITNNSPRYYVVHDADYALSGAFAYVDGASVALTGWDVGSAPLDSNYTAGKPDFKKLKLNPEKFRISASWLPGGTMGVIARATGFGADFAEASYDAGSLMAAGADFMTAGANGKKRVTSYVQTAGISPATKLANVAGNFPASDVPAGNVSGLLRAEPGSATNLTGALMDGGAGNWTGGGQAPSDQHAAGVVSLMHFDGRPDNGDPYRNFVTMSVRGNGTSSVTDETGKPFTSAGNVQISTASGVSANDANLLFDGTGDYATTPYDAASMDWWTSDYTIEAWVYPVALNTWGYVDVSERPAAIGLGKTTTQEDYWSFWPVSNGTVQFYYWNGARNSVSSTQTVTANQWNHIAMTKTSAGIRLWVNGVGNTATAISGTPLSATTYPFSIGQMNNRSINWRIDDLRITKGVARYSSNFTPTQTPAVSWAVFVDQKGATVTAAGNAQISTAQSKFWGGSAYFDGNGDYLSLAASSNFAFGTSDFTVEFWYMPTGRIDSYPRLVNFGPTWSSNDSWAILDRPAYSSTKTVFRSYKLGGGSWDGAWLDSTSVVSENAWRHVALTRQWSSFRLFIDGSLQSTYTSASAIDASATNGLNIGWVISEVSGENFTGYVDELRITKGVARYVDSFSTQTSAFPNP